MRAVWVDEGNNPDWDTLAAHHMTHIYMSLRDPRVTKNYLRDVVGRGYGSGAYVGHKWYDEDGNDPEGYVNRVSTRLREIIIGPAFPRIQLNPEWHDADYIIRVLRRWRELWPKQETSWTMEGFQGGWMTDELVAEVKRARVRLAPQYFTGDMRPRAADVIVKDLLARGFEWQRISGMYDAASLPLDWDGFAFTMGRLPR